MDDASLEEFLDSEEGETNDGSDAPASSGNDGASEDAGSVTTGPRATVEPATPTVRWSPEGGDCEACGSSVDRRWHSEVGLVCTECKEW